MKSINKKSMIFEKGDNEGLVWEYFRFNITDCLPEDLVNYSNQSILDKILSRSGVITHKIEVIIKVDDKIVNCNAWEKI